MKKVGLLTLPLVDNYGGILQAVALYECLRRLGYDVTLIRKELFQPAWKRLVIGLLEHLPFQNIRKFRSRYRNAPLHRSFIEQMIPSQSPRVVTKEELAALSQDYGFDAVVVGSDQVWRFEYIDKRFYGTYFLDFLEGLDVRRISYAASFGLDHWEAPELSADVSSWLARFESISVRETAGQKLCGQFGRNDAVHVLDPTLLAGRAFFEQVIAQEPENAIGSLLYYVLDESDFSETVLEAVQSGLGGATEISRIYESGHGVQTKTIPQWVKAFAEADFVVTDSFHGMVFSLMFNKPFLAIANHGRGSSRFEALLERLGLRDRLLLTEDSELVESLVGRAIDYQSVNSKLDQWRYESEQFLKSALGSYKHSDE